MIERIVSLWRDNRQVIFRWMDRIVWGIIRLMIIGVVVNLISSFYPEFPKRFPTIYGFFDGWLQFVEFSVKAAIGMIYSIFTNSLTEFWRSYSIEYKDLLNQFVNWLSIISKF